MAGQIQRSTRLSRVAGGVALACIAALSLAPWLVDAGVQRLILEIMIYLTLATLWNVLAGYAGLVSIGQQAYVGMGGYLMFSATMFLGLHPLLAIGVAGLLSGMLALPIAFLAFRLRGAYFGIGTWVIAESLQLAFAQTPMLGGGSGISLPISVMREMAPTKSAREAMIYGSALALCAGALLASFLMLRSRLGLALTAMRDSELASLSLGVPLGRVRLFVYIAVAVVTAMVGGLIFLVKLRITPEAAFSVNDWTAFVIFIVVIGGIGTLEGPVIGTLVFFLLREQLSGFGPLYLMFLGALAIGVMLFAPQGIWGFVRRRWGISLFPVGYTVVADAPPVPLDEPRSGDPARSPDRSR